jgi:hypothetical protein
MPAASCLQSCVPPLDQAAQAHWRKTAASADLCFSPATPDLWVAGWPFGSPEWARRSLVASPTEPSFFDCVGLKQLLPRTLGDVRDREQLERTIACARPHILLHLAAQARVGKALYEAYATFTTYALGTLNVLEAVRMAESICRRLHDRQGLRRVEQSP